MKGNHGLSLIFDHALLISFLVLRLKKVEQTAIKKLHNHVPIPLIFRTSEVTSYQENGKESSQVLVLY